MAKNQSYKHLSIYSFLTSPEIFLPGWLLAPLQPAWLMFIVVLSPIHVMPFSLVTVTLVVFAIPKK